MTLRDVFDAQYYADAYEDLTESFGGDSEMLWQHFMMCGLVEGRNMNGLIDIVNYRESRSDLRHHIHQKTEGLCFNVTERSASVFLLEITEINAL